MGYLVCEEVVNQGSYPFIVGKADTIAEVWSLIMSLGEYRRYIDNQEDALHHNTITIYQIPQTEDSKVLFDLIDRRQEKEQGQWCPSCDLWNNWLYLGYTVATYDGCNEKWDLNGHEGFSIEESKLINRVIKASHEILWQYKEVSVVS